MATVADILLPATPARKLDGYESDMELTVMLASLTGTLRDAENVGSAADSEAEP